MIGVRIRTVFRSRWNALFWASGVLLTAYCSVPAQEEPGDGEQVAALLNAAQGPQQQPTHHVNPWAK